jgi:hypothetical protein
VHIRGLFYIVVSAGIFFRPDTGQPFANNPANWVWFQQAVKAARWLRPELFPRFRDERSSPPQLFAADGREIVLGNQGLERSLAVLQGAGSAEAGDFDIRSDIYIPELAHFLPRLTDRGANVPPQPYRLAFIGEKSSLGAVLQPLAVEVHAELLLSSGDPSDTHIAELAARAAADPRPFRVLYFSDFDPTGFNMPIAVARKFQALRDLLYPHLDVELHRIALTRAQCVEFELPSTPINHKDKRAARWIDRTGREQTEIDALAALRPEILEQIARAGVAPFHDPTLEVRFVKAVQLPAAVHEWFAKLEANVEAHGIISAGRDELESAAETFNQKLVEFSATVNAQTKAVREAVEGAEDKPQVDPVTIEPEIEAQPNEPLFTASDSYIEATRKLRASKRNFSDTDDPEDEE